ncbi:family 2 glycosyl transferase [Oleiphilus messinensis]|uniref:Family 2 glycosyl transferase n=1 Tax=Oleiphilus messinensis TaxID=141451 RepID=A0A1Y0I699_9GAMM|nr:glycosyltransferase family 2 protein [Oleiphilus messinensis]ARU56017.1 family 2 glycosyl transferase [Oleiphilus messinensis]
MKSTTPKIITTVIPTYRRPQTLKRSILSALGQNIDGLIVSVYDNHSGDETKDVVNALCEHSPSINYHIHDRNIGAALNFEYGLKSVTTPYFSLLSDDDYLLPDFYRRAINALEMHPNAIFWAGTTLNVDEQGLIWDARVDRWPDEGVFSPPHGIFHIMQGMSPTWTGIVFRKEVLDSIGLPDKETLGPSDLDFVLKAAAKHSYIVEKHPSAVFTINPNSFSCTEPLSSFWPGWKKMFKNIEHITKDYSPEIRAEILKTLHDDAKRMLFRRGANAIAKKRNDFAKDAANVLREEYGTLTLSVLLKVIARLCSQNRIAQNLYTRAYQAGERKIISDKESIQRKFEHLVRPSTDS